MHFKLYDEVIINIIITVQLTASIICVIVVVVVVVVFVVVQKGEIEGSVADLETERDFYFSKLRDIELICQENMDVPVINEIMDIMYATQVK